MDFGVARELAEKLEAIREAKKQGQNVEYAVKVLAGYIYSSGRTGPDLNDIARSLLANPLDTKEAESVATKLTPDMLLTSDFLIDKISHWVELVRNEIFGSSQAPFSSNGEAEEWIQDQEQAEGWMEIDLSDGRGFATVPMNAGQELWDYVMIADSKGNVRAGNIVSIRRQIRSMSYIGGDGKEQRVHIFGPAPQKWTMPEAREYAGKYTHLNWLESETRIMESVTGFSQLSLIPFVLIGIKPILQRFTTDGYLFYFTLPNKEKLRPTRVEINILAKDLRFQELQKIYIEHREALQLQRGKTLNEKHLALYQLVKGKGIPPKGKGTVAFWNSIREEYNSRYPDDVYQSWKGVKQEYERVIQKLKDRFELAELGVIPQKEAHHERSHRKEG